MFFSITLEHRSLCLFRDIFYWKNKRITKILLTSFSSFITSNYFVRTSVQFSSVAQSCSTLYDSMNLSTPGLPVHHQLPGFTQTHAHRVSDAIQTSHLLSSPSHPAFNLPSIRVFSNESALHIWWPKYWSLSFVISLPMNIQG